LDTLIGISKVLISVTLGLTLIHSVYPAVSYGWSLINALQLITHSAAFNLSTSANVVYFN